ncbi:MAG TPA: ASCH domain-containing protein [Chlamydiales bacterium]|nr:ASCH domain-containing protein [Chlamydiales bacterium]
MPKHHELTLRKKYIHQIRSGQKTVEGRINHGMVTRYRVGDTVRFFYKQNPGDDVRCEITDIRSFKTFREMLENSGFKKCVSDIWTLDEAEDLYLNIPGYAERAAASGVLAIHIKVIPR